MGNAAKGRALGVGGVFFRSKNPERLGNWYADALGFNVDNWGGTYGTGFSPEEMPKGSFTVWSIFAKSTEYFGPSGQSHMINLVVDNLDQALENVAGQGPVLEP